MATASLQLELPIFEAEIEQTAPDPQPSATNSGGLLQADIERVKRFLELEGSTRRGAVEWHELASRIADPNLATLWILQAAINATIACGLSTGPDYMLAASRVSESFEIELKHRWAAQR